MDTYVGRRQQGRLAVTSGSGAGELSILPVVLWGELAADMLQWWLCYGLEDGEVTGPFSLNISEALKRWRLFRFLGASCCRKQALLFEALCNTRATQLTETWTSQLPRLIPLLCGAQN